MNKDSFNKLSEELIKVGLRIAKRGEGALFVVGEVEHTPLVDQKIPPFKAIDNPKLLESLALMDGAVIINQNGFVSSYGSKIKSTKVFKNYGTRHSAGLSASLNKGVVSFVISEEDKKIRVFKQGRVVMQIDSLEKGIEQKVPEINQFLESIGFGTVGSLATTAITTSAGIVGISFLPGVIIFTSIYLLVKNIKNINFFNTDKTQKVQKPNIYKV